MMTSSGGIQRQLSGQTSPLKKYQQTMVGDRGMAGFVLYELYLSLVSWLPGRLGSRLRSRILPMFLAGRATGLQVGANVTLRRPGQMAIGKNVTIGAGVTLDVKSDKGFLRIGDNVSIGENTILSCPGGALSIGNATVIGKQCRLGSLKGLRIGTACILGDRVCIVGAGHCYHHLDRPIIEQPLTCKGPGIIEDNVVIENESTVLDGVRIGKTAAVAEGAMVNRDTPAGVKVAGIPANSCV